VRSRTASGDPGEGLSPHRVSGPLSTGDLSFNVRLRDELLNGEVLYTLREAQIVIIES
jgi:hypothetical protein